MMVVSKYPPVYKWPLVFGLKSFLNTSINKKPFSFSEVVTYKNVAQSGSVPASGARGAGLNPFLFDYSKSMIWIEA